jgi:hypothetical protein
MPCTATALGEAGVAAPIFDRRSEAIGVVGPRERVFGRWPAI